MRRSRCALVLMILLSVKAATGETLQWTSLNTRPHAAGPKTILQLPNGNLLTVKHADTAERVRLVIAQSEDGVEWRDLGEVAADQPGTDLGDSHLVRLRDGRLWCSYRRNHHRGADEDRPRYAIEIAESSDNGRSWRPHSTVTAVAHAACPTRSQGLWSSFILQRRDGTLQCYFDDEETPGREGFPGHQWLVMRTWDEASSRWIDPVVVSRANDSRHLSRDGMPSVIEMEDQTLRCVYESVAVDTPHPNILRSVTSADGGRSWSWQVREREIVYQSEKHHLALAPWMVQRADGSLFVVFCTDEDRDQPSRSGLPPSRMRLDIKAIESHNQGRTWSPAATVWAGEHRNYLPGVIELHDRSLQVHCVDYSIAGTRIIRTLPVEQ